LADVTVSPIFFLTVPDRKPRTECGNQRWLSSIPPVCAAGPFQQVQDFGGLAAIAENLRLHWLDFSLVGRYL